MKNNNHSLKIRQHLEASADFLTKIDDKVIDGISEAANRSIKALLSGHKILLCGNGGSAADCQHIAGELVGRFKGERSAIAAIALTDNQSILTAIANDFGYNFVFSRQIEAIGQKGDILLALSTSGNSKNILEAIKMARRMNIYTVGLLGRDGGEAGKIVNLPIVVPIKETDYIQEVHMSLGHAICGLVESELQRRPRP
jgi:D-sedoheptulose 7-phosphate isomerase